MRRDDDGALAEAVVGDEELHAGLEKVKVCGIEGEEDVALEVGRSVCVDRG